MANNNKIITLSGLIMMIFTSIFGFGNTPVAFDQMGYASIFWYVLAALLFLAGFIDVCGVRRFAEGS